MKLDKIGIWSEIKLEIIKDYASACQGPWGGVLECEFPCAII